MKHTRKVLLFGLLVGLVAAEEPIDFQRARQLRQKQQAGEQLSEEETAYLKRAQQEYQKRSPSRPANAPAAKPALGLKPLTEMSAEDKYKGEEGGLYGGGHNDPPASQLAAAQRESKKIQPLDSEGKPGQQGKIGLISLGMSNTTQEFSKFVTLANADPRKASAVVLVDGAQGGQHAAIWANRDSGRRAQGGTPWEVLDQRLRTAGVSAPQVQAVWIKQALPGPASLGEYPAHAKQLQADLATIVTLLKERFPNLRVAYLSSRIYAGNASSALNPEPYAYESAFAVRGLIRDQINGDAKLNADPAHGAVKAPILMWGPYLWADGTTSRKSDHLVWQSEDFGGDGTHPSETGRQKVAEMLLTFFKTDPQARAWFLKP